MRCGETALVGAEISLLNKGFLPGDFGGRITYASMPFEGVDWTLFDIVSVDAYRSVEVADRFAAGIRSLVAPP